MPKYIDFFDHDEREQVVLSIKEAEKATSGEIRVHLEDHCDHRPTDRAAFIFEHLDMHKTAARNGVLFYISVCDKEFSVIGDVGIHEKVGSEYWKKLCDGLELDFKKGYFKDGLIRAIKKVGQTLVEHFPRQEGDVNELDDSISTQSIT